MELKEQLEIVDVRYEENMNKVIVTLLDEEMGEIREVNFNKQAFDKETKKFVDNPEKAAKAEEWAKENFNLPFNNLTQAIGERKDVYCYDRFNSFYEVQQVEKFSEDMVGQIITGEISNVFDDGKKIAIHFDHEGKLYESKMQYAQYFDLRKEWFVDPLKRKKQYDKFLEKFNIPVEKKEDLIGKSVMVEVKKAFGTAIYNEIKPFPKPKEKK